ncbi:MAG TPA: cardiolipin synthase [Edaphocola sp.]|nr:cardiolipin synthase [Edaphocola sp.]
MKWILILEISYIIILILVILKVLFDTRSSVKALAYILFIVLIPVVGMLFYFSFGINYRKKKLYSRKIIKDNAQREIIINQIQDYSEQVLQSDLLAPQYNNLIRFIYNSSNSPLTANNSVKLLINGEEKFPEVLKAIAAAQSHIHLEYYIYENDKTGNSIADLLIEKAKQGVNVRFIYDDFGSHSLKGQFIEKLIEGGVEAVPFYKIKLYALANSLNYRNHRKIIVIDGKKSFIGGINICDKYRNDGKTKEDLYWRDTHLMIEGPATIHLQYLFLCDWNFCSNQHLQFGPEYFPIQIEGVELHKELVQIVPSGPDSSTPVILYSLIEAIGSAKESILITSPYFIPGETLIDALIIAAKSGIEVNLLIPGISDSRMVNAAARAFYSELLHHGVKIFLYQKGFVHAKTMVIDDNLAVVGSANMDYRSFDLNFEVNAMVYSKEIAGQLRKVFNEDLLHATEIDASDWENRPKYLNLWEKSVRLLAPML